MTEMQSAAGRSLVQRTWIEIMRANSFFVSASCRSLMQRTWIEILPIVHDPAIPLVVLLCREHGLKSDHRRRDPDNYSVVLLYRERGLKLRAGFRTAL